MNLQTLQALLNLINVFLEFLQAVQYPPSLRIVLYDFTNTSDLHEVAKYFARISTNCTRSPKLQNIFLDVF